MHEVSIMQSTLELAEQSAKASGASQIHQLRLRVGRMTGLVRESLESAFEIVRAGSMAASARLEVVEVPVTCWCEPCQAEFVSEDLLYECPRCQTLSRQLKGGLELELVSLEIS